MKYLSLFSGVGGFEKGIEQAYENLQNLSDTQAYKVYGNAVTVNVVQAVMERLLDE